MKIDCSITKNYLKEKARMTKNCIISSCNNCPLSSINNSEEYSCFDFEIKYTEMAIEIVQKWSDEHPQKTYKEDFFEKFPNAKKGVKGYPFISRPCNIYPQLKSTCYDYLYCSDCWDKLMEE